MAKKKLPSKILKDLGFVKQLREKSEKAEMKRVTGNLRELLKRKRGAGPADTTPTFIHLGPSTYATDERGSHWIAGTIVDLAPFGFKNKQTSFRKLAKEVLAALQTQ